MKSNSHEKHQCAHGLCAPVDVMVAYTVAISVCFAVQSGQASIQKLEKSKHDFLLSAVFVTPCANMHQQIAAVLFMLSAPTLDSIHNS